jgi:hypothetical protein
LILFLIRIFVRIISGTFVVAIYKVKKQMKDEKIIIILFNFELFFFRSGRSDKISIRHYKDYSIYSLFKNSTLCFSSGYCVRYKKKLTCLERHYCRWQSKKCECERLREAIYCIYKGKSIVWNGTQLLYIRSSDKNVFLCCELQSEFF